MCSTLIVIVILLFFGVSNAALERKIVSVATNQQHYVNKAIWVNGMMDISHYYGGKYSRDQDTHFAFKLSDDTGTAYVYVKKNKGKSLRNKIISTGRPVKGTFVFKIMDDKHIKNSGTIFAELCVQYFDR